MWAMRAASLTCSNWYSAELLIVRCRQHSNGNRMPTTTTNTNALHQRRVQAMEH